MKKEFEVISQIIQNNKRVLDIGCGDGTLMEYLKVNQQNDVRGLEPEKNLVQKCISKGLSVIEGDAEKELVQFPKKSFDYVVLSQTLQAFLRPEEVLDQLLRIGKQTIVSIPNFGYWKVRLHLLFKGTMPITKNYNITPMSAKRFNADMSDRIPIPAAAPELPFSGKSDVHNGERGPINIPANKYPIINGCLILKNARVTIAANIIMIARSVTKVS